MRAVLWARMNVAVHSGGWNGHALERLRRETLFQRLLERLHAEHAIAAGAGHRHADIGAALGHEYADQCETRCRVLELLVGRLFRDRETDLGDDLAFFQRGRE